MAFTEQNHPLKTNSRAIALYFTKSPNPLSRLSSQITTKVANQLKIIRQRKFRGFNRRQRSRGAVQP